MRELGPKARAVVEAGRAGDEATPADRARIRAALMASIAAGGAGAASVMGEGAAAAGAAKGAVVAGTVGLGLGAGWLAVVVGLAVVSTVATVVTVVRGPEGALAEPVASSAPIALVAPSPIEAARVPAAATKTPREAPVAVTTARSAPPAPASSARLAEREREPVEPPPAAAAPAAPTPPADSLEEETRRLGEAHGALKDGNPARALALLDEQAVTYQSGQLREERAAARILALCKLGRVDEAKALAARFVAESPRSPLANRVRAACATAPSL